MKDIKCVGCKFYEYYCEGCEFDPVFRIKVLLAENIKLKEELKSVAEKKSQA